MAAPKIEKLLTPYNFTNKDNAGRIKYIVIHYVGALGGAEANCKYYASKYLGASAHYFVGFNGEVWQSVEDEDIAWHCGASSYKHAECRNSNSIGIEMCVRNKGTGANDVDIMLDEDGQPVSDGNGDTALVSDDECWLQDIKNEAMTEEGELFYEDEEGDASYGWSLLDFMQGEYDDFTQMEIQQRIRSKMSKRDYIDAGSIQTTVNFDGHIYHIRIAFRRTDSNSEYNIDIESNGVEVIVE